MRALCPGATGRLAVFFAAKAERKRFHVFVDETRPVLQGARLTAWELKKTKIPYTLICDNMAGYLMKQGKIDMVITGADRIERRYSEQDRNIFFGGAGKAS